MITSTLELPKPVQDYFTCTLLHTKTPTWDGTYTYDEYQEKNIPNIKWICKECSGKE